MADRVLRHLDEHRLARGQGVLDALGLVRVEAGGIPVDLARVEHGVAALADVDEGRLHRGQHVLDPTQVDVAGHRDGGRLVDVVLDEDAVLEDAHLGAAVLVPHDHDAIDRLASGEELGLRDDGAAAPGLPPLAATLLLGLEARGAPDADRLITLPTGLADPGRDVRGILTAFTGSGPCPAPTTAAAGGDALLVSAVLVLLGLRLGVPARLSAGTLRRGFLVGRRLTALFGSLVLVLRARLVAFSGGATASSLAAPATARPARCRILVAGYLRVGPCLAGLVLGLLEILGVPARRCTWRHCGGGRLRAATAARSGECSLGVRGLEQHAEARDNRPRRLGVVPGGSGLGLGLGRDRGSRVVTGAGLREGDRLERVARPSHLGDARSRARSLGVDCGLLRRPLSGCRRPCASARLRTGRNGLVVQVGGVGRAGEVGTSALTSRVDGGGLPSSWCGGWRACAEPAASGRQPVVGSELSGVRLGVGVGATSSGAFVG